MNYEKRITAAEALQHPYFAKLHLLKDEPVREPVNSREFEFEQYEMTAEQLKDLLYEEILIYHFPEFK